MNFSALFIRRPVATLVLTALLLVIGLLSAGRIPTDLFPQVDSPVVVVKTGYPGAGAPEVESDVTTPIEDALAGLNGLDTLRSRSSEGVSTVTAEFKLEVPDAVAVQDVRDRVAALAGSLPDDAEPPVIVQYNPSDRPIATYAVTGHVPIERLSALADELVRPRLERIDGVGLVELVGDRPSEVLVAVDTDWLDGYGLSLVGVFQGIADANADRPAGRMQTAESEQSVRTVGKAAGIPELGALPLLLPHGGTVPLSDVAEIHQGPIEARTVAKVDGAPAVMLTVRKRADGNTVAIAEAIAHGLEGMRQSLPAGVELVTVNDGSDFIEESVEAVWEALLIGGAIAVIVIAIFLRNGPATVIGAIAMPLSVVAAFTFMHLAGLSFNLLSTLGLSLAIGILVDDAVVDLENIHRHIEAGKPPLQAAIEATGEIQLAVTATTLTIVAVFLPVAFMDGLVGQFFREFGLTVTFAVLISLLIARTLTPMLAARFATEPTASAAPGWLERGYGALLGWCLDHRGLTLAVAVGTLAAALALVPLIPKGFMTTADRAQFNVIVEQSPGASLQATEASADAVVDRLRRHPEVTHAFTRIGEDGVVHRAAIEVALVPRGERALTDRQFARSVLPELQTVPGVRVRIEEVGMMGQAEQNLPVYIVLRGAELAALERQAEAIAAALRRAGGFVDVDTSAEPARTELVAGLDHVRAADLRVNAATFSRTLRLATSGEVVSSLTIGGEEVDVRVQARREVRGSEDRLSALAVPTQLGSSVRVSQVADVGVRAAPASLEHRDRVRTVSVTANLTPGYSVGDATAAAERLVAELGLEPGIEVQFLGQADWMRETFDSLKGALLLAVVFIYMILAVQFESLIHPFTIMMSLPLALSGAFLGLFLTGKELGLVTMIGLIMLMGLVTKNGILLVDFSLHKRRDGLTTTEALLAAAPLRLRPILMTSTAMIGGMAPIALEVGAASEFRSPMGIVVVGGLISSTFLTLLVVPVVFSLAEQAQAWIATLPEGGLRRRRDQGLTAPTQEGGLD